MQRFLLQECTDDCTLLEVLEYPSASMGLQVMPIFLMPMLSSLVSILLSPPSLSSPSFFPSFHLPIYQQTHLQSLGLHGRGQVGGTDSRLSTISSIPWGNMSCDSDMVCLTDHVALVQLSSSIWWVFLCWCFDLGHLLPWYHRWAHMTVTWQTSLPGPT